MLNPRSSSAAVRFSFARGTSHVAGGTSYVLLALLIASITSACSVLPRPTNVLLITLDTTRADRLPAYGFIGVDTPALDRLAAEGVVFEQTFASVPLTLPSHATLFTGLYPPRLRVRDNAGEPLPDRFTTLAEVLRATGLTTAAFVASGVVATGRGLEQGFQVYNDVLSPECEGTPRARRPASDVTDAALSWLGRNDSDPFFVWIHLYDNHRPYDLPAAYMRRYLDPYLAAIAFEDSQISRVIAYLEAHALLKNTMIVVAGDHGESLGDHGEESHGIFVYQEGLHVPFILRVPGIAPRRVGAVTRLVDVMPTILEFFGVKRAGLDGVSLASLATGIAKDPQLEVYSESLYAHRFGWASLRSLRADRYKVIEAPRPELYDLATDPGEQRNLFDERRAIGTAMLDRLHAFDSRPNGTSARMSLVDRSVIDRISSVGYVGVTAKEIAPTAGDLPDPKDRIETFNRMTNLHWQNAGSFQRAQTLCGIPNP